MKATGIAVRCLAGHLTSFLQGCINIRAIEAPVPGLPLKIDLSDPNHMVIPKGNPGQPR